VITNVTASPNADPTARYLSQRSAAALREVGALDPLLDTIVRRIAAYGAGPFGVEALRFAEDPVRYNTFLPQERAAFPQLWALLELDPGLDLEAESAIASLEELATEVEPEPERLDDQARVAIADLPEVLQEVAWRVFKAPGAPADTIAYAEVFTALAEYDRYVSAEYFRFGALLRAIEGELVTPAGFPHLAILGDLEQEVTLEVGGAQLHVSRSVLRKSCDSRYHPARVETQVTLSYDLPPDTFLTWTPLTGAGALFPRRQSSWGSDREINVLPASTDKLRLLGHSRAAALVEAWQGGVRQAQAVVVLPGDERRYGEGRAIVEGGEFNCLPFEDALDETDSLSNVIRLAPGSYPVPAGSYGAAQLQIYGRGVMRLDVGAKIFWAVQEPTPTSSVQRYCWGLTSLGPTNRVTGASGAGPGFRFEYATNEIYFDEESYGICFGDGQLVATLTAADRL
jgi:hypothetical protein